MIHLQTNRLVLRELKIVDLLFTHHLNALPEIDRFNTSGIPANEDVSNLQLIQWISHQVEIPRTSYILGIELATSNELIGLIALVFGKPNYNTAEVWYKTLPNYWNKGYTTEAMQQLLKFGFAELKLHRIEAGCAVENNASIRVLEKVGLQREGRKRKILPIRNEWKDNFFYAILEEDYFQANL